MWICEACGRPHPAHEPPCAGCGHPEFEQVRDELVPENAAELAFAWACPECGKRHDAPHARCVRCDAMGLRASYVDPTDRHADARRLLGLLGDTALWVVTIAFAVLALGLGGLFLTGGSPRFGAPVFAVGLFTLPSARERLALLTGLTVPGRLVGLLWYNV